MGTRSHDAGRRQFLEQMTLAAGAAGIGSLTNAAAAPDATPAPAGKPATARAMPAPLRNVEGKVAFITGASSGIGLGQARVFHEAGMKVAIGYIRDDQIGPAMESFKHDRDRVLPIKVNVTDREAMRRAADEIEAKFGRIHLLSNNAGIGLLTPVSAVEYQDFDQTIAVNLVGVFNGVHEFLPRLKKHGEGGHIVTTSSMGGLLPTEGGGAGIYTATKFATVGMMEALRSEFDAARINIGCSVYCPGLVNTNIFEVEKNLNAAFREGANHSASSTQMTAEGEARIRGIIAVGMDPLEAGRFVLNGVRNNDLFILSHPEFLEGMHERHQAIEASVPRGSAPKARMEISAATLHNSIYPNELAKMKGRRKA